MICSVPRGKEIRAVGTRRDEHILASHPLKLPCGAAYLRLAVYAPPERLLKLGDIRLYDEQTAAQRAAEKSSRRVGAESHAASLKRREYLRIHVRSDI